VAMQRNVSVFFPIRNLLVLRYCYRRCFKICFGYLGKLSFVGPLGRRIQIGYPFILLMDPDWHKCVLWHHGFHPRVVPTWRTGSLGVNFKELLPHLGCE